MIRIFGEGIPTLFNYVGMASVLFFLIKQGYNSSLVKFKYESYNKEDAMLTGYCFLVLLVIILSYIFRSKLAYYIFYYLYNFMFFLGLLAIINTFLLANSKFKYTSILGEGDKYKSIMRGIVKRRHYGFGLSILICLFLRLSIQIYPKGGKVFLVCIFLTFTLTLGMYYMYSKNDRVLTRGKSGSIGRGTVNKKSDLNNNSNSTNNTTEKTPVSEDSNSDK